jgi:hypothetical protein
LGSEISICLVRKDMDINKHDRLSTITLKHKIKSRNTACIALLYFIITHLPYHDILVVGSKYFSLLHQNKSFPMQHERAYTNYRDLFSCNIKKTLWKKKNYSLIASEVIIFLKFFIYIKTSPYDTNCRKLATVDGILDLSTLNFTKCKDKNNHLPRRIQCIYYFLNKTHFKL